MANLFHSYGFPVALRTRQMNHLNGSDAESRAATILTFACRGEVRWGSRLEDGSGIDILMSAAHPWYPGERMMVLAQVKSGDSHGSKVGERSGFVLKKQAIVKAARTSHALCVLWVDEHTGDSYWAYLKPTSRRNDTKLGEHHRVTPATLYDLARCIGAYSPLPRGGVGITVATSSGVNTGTKVLATKRSRARTAYFREKSAVQSPVMGPVELTRLGWRHMFRKGRRAAIKNTSLELIPHLRNLLTQVPSSHVVTKVDFSNAHPEWVLRSSEHLLIFDEIALSQKGSSKTGRASAYVRLLEEIRFPYEWTLDPMLSQRVQRRVVVQTCYYK